MKKDKDTHLYYNMFAYLWAGIEEGCKCGNGKSAVYSKGKCDYNKVSKNCDSTIKYGTYLVPSFENKLICKKVIKNSNSISLESNSIHNLASGDFRCKQGYKECNQQSSFKSYKTCVN